MQFPKLFITEDGWCDGAGRVPSPNCDARPDGLAIDLLVLHNISLPPGSYGSGDIERLFTNTLDFEAHPYFATIAGQRVSAHFLVGRDGRLFQFVSGNQRAWHAGVSSFEGRARCNDYSIGIELEGTDTQPFETAQYLTLSPLVHALAQRYPIKAVAGHSDIACGRKTDPGPYFDWRRFSSFAPQNLRTPLHTPLRR